MNSLSCSIFSSEKCRDGKRIRMRKRTYADFTLFGIKLNHVNGRESSKNKDCGCRGQRLVSGIFLDCSVLYWEAGSLPEPRACQLGLTSLATQLALGTPIFTSGVLGLQMGYHTHLAWRLVLWNNEPQSLFLLSQYFMHVISLVNYLKQIKFNSWPCSYHYCSINIFK